MGSSSPVANPRQRAFEWEFGCRPSSPMKLGKVSDLGSDGEMATIHAFGPFRLDADAETLYRGSEPLPIGKRAVALLRVLIERAGALVSKDTLIDAAWSGLAVEESNLTVQIAALRRALSEVPGGGVIGSSGPLSQRARRKYSQRMDPSAKPSPTMAPALPDKPSIAVLPFENLSGDPEQGYFADGIVEEIITALSRIRWLFVIARNSSFTYKGRAVDVKQVGRELGALYVLEGSVRKAGNRIRITAQLLDATTAVHLWADRFDGSLEDVFVLQDKVASSVPGVIEPALQAAETSRSAGRPTADLTAYDLYLGTARFGAAARKIASPGRGWSGWPATGSLNLETSTPGQMCDLPSNTRGKNRMPELGPSESVRGAVSNHRPYRDPEHVPRPRGLKTLAVRFRYVWWMCVVLQ